MCLIALALPGKRGMLCAGVQFDSRKASSAVMHFPSSKRDAAEKLYISAEHEKSGYGRDSPGENLLRALCSASIIAAVVQHAQR